MEFKQRLAFLREGDPKMNLRAWGQMNLRARGQTVLRAFFVSFPGLNILSPLSLGEGLGVRLLFYSALSASIGLTLAALMAGMSPAMVPAMMITSVACMQTSRPTVGLRNIEA